MLTIAVVAVKKIAIALKDMLELDHAKEPKHSGHTFDFGMSQSIEQQCCAVPNSGSIL